MIYLDATTKSLTVKLDGAPATTQAVVTAYYYDVIQQTTAGNDRGASKVSVTSGVTPVTIVAAPPRVNIVRNVHTIMVNNRDSVTRIVTITLVDGSTNPPQVSQSLAAGSSLVYETNSGWQVLDPITAPFVDSTEIVYGSSDTTKRMRFEVDTLVPTSSTVVLTVPAASGVISTSTSALTAGRVVYTDTGGILAASASLTWSGSGTLALTGAQTISSTLNVTGTTTLGTTNTGALSATTGSFSSTLAVTGHTTFEGVTSTGATGTGNIVYSASPTFTGTLIAAAANFSGNVTLGDTTGDSHTVNGLLRVTAANDAFHAFIGASKAIRIYSHATGSSIEGVDNTLNASYQPLNISASSLALQISGVTVIAVSAGGAAITGTLSTTGALTYGGVTLNNAVTGTGNMVLSASPTLTGTITAATANFSGLVSVNAGDSVNTLSVGNSTKWIAWNDATSTYWTTAVAGGGQGLAANATTTALLVGGSTALSVTATTTTVVGTLSGAAANFSGAVGGVTATFTKATAGDSVIFTNGGASNKTGYLYSDDTHVGMLDVASGGATFNGFLLNRAGLLSRIYANATLVAEFAAGATALTGTLSTTGALTYGGVTLNNAVTGTGNMVLSASPTLSGTVGGALTFSGALTLSSAMTYGGVTLSNAVSGTGSMVLSASPTLTGTITAAAANFSGAMTGTTVTFTKATAGDSIVFTNGGASNKSGYLYSDDTNVGMLDVAGGGATFSGVLMDRAALATRVYANATQVASFTAGATALTGTLAVSGNVTLGDATGDTLIYSGDQATFGSTGVDSSTKLLVRGSARGVRIGASATVALVEGVDQTGSGSYQPLNVSGSVVTILDGGTTVAVFDSGSVAITGTLSTTGALTYGGVTLSNSVTGTGKMVLDTTPTLATPVFSGTPTGTVTSGTYTPTLTGVANIASSTALECQYIRVGNVVTVSGGALIDPTAAVATSFRITLPVASNLGTAQDLGGGGVFSGATIDPLEILADTTNDAASIAFIAGGTSSGYATFTFTYQVI
jgi:fibronectin-binding autotransporter adhesin